MAVRSVEPPSSGFRDRIAATLAVHKEGGYVNSKEGCTACYCDEKLYHPSGLDSDGYPRDWDEHDRILSGHQADMLLQSGLISNDIRVQYSKKIDEMPYVRIEYMGVAVVDGQLREPHGADR